MAAAVLVTVAALPGTAPAAAQEPLRLLDVPFLSQTEALCGGASAAMVLRYWGATDVRAEAFANLVRPEEGGIRGEDLLRAVRERGWPAESFRGDPGSAARHIAAGRPVIALVEDRPSQFHYVVLLGWLGDRVVAHDPARAPFRVVGERDFVAAWAKSGFWTMLILPGEQRPSSRAADVDGTLPASPRGRCDPIVSEGVRLAQTGDTAAAMVVLEVAARVCATEAAPPRERAGVHVRRGEWRDAEVHAREALRRDPADRHAARILGTVLYLQDRSEAALGAWNGAGEPIVDLVNVSGLERTRHDVAARLLRTRPQELLTGERLAAAGRRLAELPSAQISRVSYAPAAGGRANVEAAVVERPVVPTGMVPLAVLGLRAAIDREAALTVSSPLGGGETLQAAWRWWENRPAAWFALAVPAPVDWAGAVWNVRLDYERQSYGSGGGVVETRRGGSFSIADWHGHRWRWEAGAGLHRWTERGTAFSLDGALARRARDDRWHVRATGSIYAGGLTAGLAALDAAWQSARATRGPVWHARGGITSAAHEAPLDLWPGAGTGQGRAVLLRAHPLLDDGVVRNGVFGRTLLHGGVEWRTWMGPRVRPLLRVAPAVFLDVARAARSIPGFDRRTHADVGVGLRVGIPGAGALRLDLARGLRDGSVAFSAGLTR